MYLAMLRARRMEESLPPKQRAWTTGLEACLVAPVLDLGPRDVVADALTGSTIRFLRGSSLDSTLQPGGRTRRTPVFAEAGKGAALAADGSPAERLWRALGAAAALGATAMRTEGGGTQRCVAVIYLRAGEGSPALRRSLLAYAAEHLLPAVFVALPRPGPVMASSLAGVARESAVPTIAVDRSDAVAIYRVAQESIGRARAGGGPALIECVPFVPERTQGPAKVKERKTTDPLTIIERYILARALVTPEWISRESRTLASRLPRPVH